MIQSNFMQAGKDIILILKQYDVKVYLIIISLNKLVNIIYKKI